MTKRLLFIPLFIFAGLLGTHAQKILQIEKYGSPKTQKIFIGEEITFMLKGDNEWKRKNYNDNVND